MLCDLWRVAPDEAALLRLAAKLGADVPVCVAGRPSFVGGIGEEIAPAEGLPACWLLLVNPRVATPTPAVFKARRGDFSAPGRWTSPPRDFAEFAARLAACRNDLTEAAISVTPPIREVLAAIEALPGCALARLSGSGATCFGLFADEAAARARADAHAGAAIPAGGRWPQPLVALAAGQFGQGGPQFLQQGGTGRAIDRQPGGGLEVVDGGDALVIDHAVERTGRKAELIQQRFDFHEVVRGDDRCYCRRRRLARPLDSGEAPQQAGQPDGKHQGQDTEQKTRPGRPAVG